MKSDSPMAAEKAAFWQLPGDAGTLYTVLHRPVKGTPDRAVVVVPALGRERLRVYREMANMARHLAARGLAVLRFDWRGEGESSGSFRRSTLASRLDDLSGAVDLLRQRTGRDEVVLLGPKLGGTLALMAAPSLGADRLILWEPVTNLKSYARSLLRANLLHQNHYFGEIRNKDKELRGRLANGEPVACFGFQLGKPLLDALESTDLAPHIEGFSGHATLLYCAPKQVPPRPDMRKWKQALERAGARCDAACCVLNFSWTSRKTWQPNLAPLNEAVQALLEDR